MSRIGQLFGFRKILQGDLNGFSDKSPQVNELVLDQAILRVDELESHLVRGIFRIQFFDSFLQILYVFLLSLAELLSRLSILHKPTVKASGKGDNENK